LVVIIKELVGMKMGKEYSFGNTVDFPEKGTIVSIYR